MPLYNYRCKNCTNEVERLVSFSDREKYLNMECLICKHKVFELTIGKSNFQLKGNGWYKDGYGKSKENSQKKA